jgi:hypothetical protein
MVPSSTNISGMLELCRSGENKRVSQDEELLDPLSFVCISLFRNGAPVTQVFALLLSSAVTIRYDPLHFLSFPGASRSYLKVLSTVRYMVWENNKKGYGRACLPAIVA